MKGIGEGKAGSRDIFLSAAKEFSTIYVPLYEKWYYFFLPSSIIVYNQFSVICRLGDNEFFGGKTPSAADCFAGYLCFYATLEVMEGIFLTSEKLLAYWGRIKKRDSFQKALKGSPYFKE